MLGLENFPAVTFDGGDSLIQAPLAIEIEQRAMSRGFDFFTVRRNKAAADGPLFMRQHRKVNPGELLFLHGGSEDSGIETDGALEIGYG